MAIFKACGDATRLRILRVLLAGAFNVNEIVGILEMGQSRVSRHLKILLDSRLVRTRREGSWIYYALSDLWSPGASSAASLEFLERLAVDLRTRAGPDKAAIRACFEARRQHAECFFSGVAESWDEQRDRVHGSLEDLHDRLVAHVAGDRGGGATQPPTIVDLGTGTGVLLPRLSPRAERVIGIDASAGMLRVAAENIRKARLGNVELRLGALEHLPLSNDEADVMVANMVLHHVAQPLEALREIRRGLRAGGCLLIADFQTHTEESYREKLGDLWLGFGQTELERWLDEADLEMTDYETSPEESDRPAAFLAVAAKPTGE